MPVASWVKRRRTLRILRQQQLQSLALKITPRTNLPPPVHSGPGFDALLSPYVRGPSNFLCSYVINSPFDLLQRRIIIS
jgi:hypothetical protein